MPGLNGLLSYVEQIGSIAWEGIRTLISTTGDTVVAVVKAICLLG